MTRSFLTAGVAVSLVVAGFLASTASARVWADVYLSDEVTPLPLADPNIPDVYRDIMVGTRLAIFISSDTAEAWDGIVWQSQEESRIGTILGRGFDLESGFYEDSRLAAAGERASVTEYLDPAGLYFLLLSRRYNSAGEWFVLDYDAVAVGTCTLGLYAYGPSDPNSSQLDPEIADPPPFDVNLLQVLSFQHVPSRDYDQDFHVNFTDFAMLADRWRVADVGEPNAAPVVDLNADERVDARDMALFSEYWLERTQAMAPGADPNVAVAVP